MATLDTIARPYALAVFTIAEEAGEIDAWSDHLHFLEALSLNKDMVSFAENPTATQSDIALNNFVRLLVKNDRWSAVSSIKRIFEELKASQNQIVEATISTAFEIQDDDLKRVSEVFSKKLGKKIRPTVKVDPKLIGGVKVEIGDKVWDLSVNGKLAEMVSNLSK